MVGSAPRPSLGMESRGVPAVPATQNMWFQKLPPAADVKYLSNRTYFLAMSQ